MPAPMSAPPDVIRWSPRSDANGDCAVAALEIACGVTYEVALAAAITFEPEVHKNGMTIAQIKNAAKLLGWTTRYRKKFDLDEDTGILDVEEVGEDGKTKPDTGHVVYLWEGRVIEPAAWARQMWLSAEDYLAYNRFVALGLLTLKRMEGR